MGKSKPSGESISIFTVNGHKEWVFQSNMNHFYHLIGETQDKLIFVDSNSHLNFPSVFCKYLSTVLFFFSPNFHFIERHKTAVMRSSVMFRSKRFVDHRFL